MVTLARRRTGAVALVSEGAAAGDFRALYDAHFAFVWRTLLRFGVPHAAAEDAAQEVFVTLYRRLDDYDGQTPLRSWLWGICRRVAQGEYRSRSRADRRAESAPPPPSPSVPPDAALERKEAVDFVQRFIDGLPEELREVFVLMEIEALSAPEVAAALELKVNTVYSRLRLSRERFEQASARLRAREGRRTA
jgi:RNA polymerase sigma-70 factor (ECF subfamily)